jgi:acetyl esterase/lipase
MGRFLLVLSCLAFSCALRAEDPTDVWPGLAPGEITRLTGETLPFRESEVPPVTRVIKITRPTFTAYLAPDPSGAGVVILPGGGFIKVVPDKEGSEAAHWLNEHGVSAFVLNYRTTEGNSEPGWIGPLQDAQRTLATIRSQADKWGLRQDRIGLVGFSAGGQVAARLLTDGGELAYDRIDKIDDVSHRPDFAMLIYPWNIYDGQRDALIEGITVSKDCQPTFLVHTDDDRSSSLGSTYYYTGLKRLGIPAELHIYGNGGHGYGMREVEGSTISSWTEHATHWLGTHHYLNSAR